MMMVRKIDALGTTSGFTKLTIYYRPWGNFTSFLSRLGKTKQNGDPDEC
jgi:hypothetical protein